ncbi:hypothetical protein A2982_02975 [candidate division WWE3 bacterium RIFCSPLOWO2_01_FULL_39_13]|uniref:Uncharacterized protein n=1 Tax=candidate division WWE3 bacterium RIFCSPLOWO2_01_FULL_39_13 TaxID=1802624 RepID=A0A1F4V1N7_UNCKA|nr:MAG: hypothetical protein A2982_02975 [candidate division WWE3 bacterium RIFCSPLOWO2_01_FULL_39_13]
MAVFTRDSKNNRARSYKYLERSIKLPVQSLTSAKVVPEEVVKESEDIDVQSEATTQSQETKLVLGANIFIPNIWLPDKLYRYLRKYS